MKIFVFLMISGMAIAQPKFEVASIKPADPSARGTFIRAQPGGRVTISNMTLKDLITFSWRIQPFQIIGGPPWLNSERFDISAKSEDAPKDGEMQLMMRSLLADRFRLQVKRETKELPIYALVLARKDGKLGPKLVESKEGGCTPRDPSGSGPSSEPGKMNCGQQMMSPRSVTAASIPISNLIPMLARLLGRTIVDKTGLTSNFDINMEWAPDEAVQLGPEVAKASDGSGPSIFTALQEQLGLKLEAQRGPVEVFVVERAEKPTEN